MLKGAIKTKPFSQLPKIKREWKVRNTGSYNQAHLNELLAAINNLKGNPAVKDVLGRATLICANLVLRWSEVSGLEVNHQYLRWVGKGNKAELTPELKAKLKIVKTTDYFKIYWNDRVNTSYLREKYLLTNRSTTAQWTPHDLRHYFARQLFFKTGNILKVQVALNHSSSTTAIYLKDYFNFKV